MEEKVILVIEDEEDIQELLTYNLTSNGYAVDCVSSGEEALQIINTKLPDLILLDLMLPGIDGLTVCKQLKADDRTKSIPIVILSAKGEEVDIVVGLELGADDYIAKPFSVKVLIARVRSALRRKRKKSTSVISRNGIVINPEHHEMLLDGRPADLTYTEFGILHLMASQPGLVFTRSQIVDAVRGEDYAVTDRSVDVHIAGLRKKLGQYSKYIETVRGIGYRFKER